MPWLYVMILVYPCRDPVCRDNVIVKSSYLHAGNPHTDNMALQWCHNECNGISNHRRLHYLLKHLSRCRSKKTSKHLITGLCEGNSPMTVGFPTQRASNMENVSIWLCHHGIFILNQGLNLHTDVTQTTPNIIVFSSPLIQTIDIQ